MLKWDSMGVRRRVIPGRLRCETLFPLTFVYLVLYIYFFKQRRTWILNLQAKAGRAATAASAPTLMISKIAICTTHGSPESRLIFLIAVCTATQAHMLRVHSHDQSLYELCVSQHVFLPAVFTIWNDVKHTIYHVGWRHCAESRDLGDRMGLCFWVIHFSWHCFHPPALIIISSPLLSRMQTSIMQSS